LSIREVNRILAEYAKQKLDPKSERATRWLAANLSKIQSQMRPDSYGKTKPSVSNPSALKEGSMIFFGYDPKGKERLPLWDEYPLIVFLKRKGNSILGLNLHYLSPPERATFLNMLIQTVDNPDYHRNPPSYINATYNQLKGNKYLRHCIKRYVMSNIKTKVNVIPSDEWKIVTFLPIDRFVGGSRAQAWARAAK